MVNRQLCYCYEYVVGDACTLYIVFKIIMIKLIVLCFIFQIWWWTNGNTTDFMHCVDNQWIKIHSGSRTINNPEFMILWINGFHNVIIFSYKFKFVNCYLKSLNYTINCCLHGLWLFDSIINKMKNKLNITLQLIIIRSRPFEYPMNCYLQGRCFSITL